LGIDNERPSVDPFHSDCGLQVWVHLHEVQTSAKLLYEAWSCIHVVKCIGQLAQICSSHQIYAAAKQSTFSERVAGYRYIVLPLNVQWAIVSHNHPVIGQSAVSFRVANVYWTGHAGKQNRLFSIKCLSYFCVLWSVSCLKFSTNFRSLFCPNLETLIDCFHSRLSLPAKFSKVIGETDCRWCQD
jgi:hypothetical protein